MNKETYEITKDIEETIFSLILGILMPFCVDGKMTNDSANFFAKKTTKEIIEILTTSTPKK
jgi:hypothetical protein